MIRLTKKVLDYIKRSEQLHIIPNFYLSLPYLELTGARCYESGGWIWIEDNGVCLFPPLNNRDYTPQPGFFPVDFVWSDFVNLRMPTSVGSATLLDFEYIYDPNKFLNLKGGDWATFRKNIHKWPRNNPKWSYTKDLRVTPEAVEKLLVSWLERKGSVEDAELIARYVLVPPVGVSRGFLYSDDKLIAVNCWDENSVHLNYRYIVCKNEPFVDEFARWLFYTNSIALLGGKPVNDGGSLGNPGLAAFKDKLNPIRKREVHSWRSYEKGRSAEGTGSC